MVDINLIAAGKKVLSLSHGYQIFGLVIGGNKFRRVLTNQYLRISPGSKVLDIGCGTADILDSLPEVDYLGIDISERYISAATKRFGGRGEFVCGTTESIDSTVSADVVMCIGLLHHVDDDTARRLLSFASRSLRPRGRLITVDPAFTPEQHPIARWLASRDRGQNVRTPENLGLIIKQEFPSAEIDVRHDLLNIPYTHVICSATRI